MTNARRDEGDQTAGGKHSVPRIAARVGLVLHVLIGVFPFAASGLLAPAWAVAALLVWWLALLVVAWRLQPERPWLTFAVPFVALAGWFVVITAGDLFLDWTA